MTIQSTTYDRYYSASDVQVIISNIDNTEMLTLDLATGIGFNESSPLRPIYGIGNPMPSFFVRNNSITTGFLGLAYKHDSYLYAAINNLYNITTKEEKKINNILTFEDLQNEKNKRDLNKAQSSINNTLINNQKSFNLKLIFSYSNVNDSNYKEINIYNCRLIGRSIMINSDGENPVSEGFSFVATHIG